MSRINDLFNDLPWAQFKALVVAKSLRMQYVEIHDCYWVKAFDGRFELGCLVKKETPESIDQLDFEANYKDDCNEKLDPRDTDGSTLQRTKVTTTGWHLQLNAIEVSTSTWNGFRNKFINPTTLAETDLGFVTFKLFDVNRVEITDSNLANTACYTQVDWCVNHDMGIVGALLCQSAPPASDIYMYTIGAPGIANIAFGTGGVNLACIGIGGSIDADGKAEKFLSPTLPIPGVNKFRTIFAHGPGVIHKCQIIFKLFMPT